MLGFQDEAMRKLQITRVVIAALAAVLQLAFSIAAQNVSQVELQFRAALHRHQVEGDLAGAIELYKSVASSKTAERAVKAKALLQLAACYEKLGQESRAVYQQILRDFFDQPEAKTARAKLDALKPPATPAT